MVVISSFPVAGLSADTIGEFIGLKLNEIKETKITCITLVVNNGHLSGIYIVPLMLGLSTPLKDVGKDGLLSLHNSTKYTADYTELYEQWCKICNQLRDKKESPRNVSTDKITCAICLNDYTNNEPLEVLPCGHAFHIMCIHEFKTAKLPKDFLGALAVITGSYDYCCPLCRQVHKAEPVWKK